MSYVKPLKSFLFKAVNVIIGLGLILLFYFFSLSIIKTFPYVRLNALSNIKPELINYFWALNINRASLDLNQLRSHADYFERFIELFPNLYEGYGILGFCYHYLGDDPKAIEYLKMAITHNPYYFWNYYNLAMIYTNHHQYDEALELLQKAIVLDPLASIKIIFASQYSYFMMIPGKPQEALPVLLAHLKDGYQQSLSLMKLLHQYRAVGVNNIPNQKPMELYAF